MLETTSQALSLASLSESDRLKTIEQLSDEEAEALIWSWDFWSRPEQRAPVDPWTLWLYLSGRGSGKTRTAAEQVIKWAEDRRDPIALVARTPADVRDTMIDGPGGIITNSPPWFRPRYQTSKRRLTWPNGAVATTFTSYEPDALRGPQHQTFWADELASWKYVQETWDMLMFGWRMGDPQGVITTTPRPIPILKEILADADPMTFVTRGSTYDNRANLPIKFFNKIIKKYEGTRLGRQELKAEMLDEVEGALWKLIQIDADRVLSPPCGLVRIVVSIDPPAKATGAEAGIMAAGRGTDGHIYILSDRSGQGSPDEWGREGVGLYHELQADRLVGEVNNGGEMVEHVVQSCAKAMAEEAREAKQPSLPSRVSYRAVHASRGKQTRAEPIAALYEQHKVHHVGAFPELEDQMCTWVPGEKSPDRMDSLVWALTELEQSGTITSGMTVPVVGARPSPWRIT